MRPQSWFAAWVRAFTAERRAALSTQIIFTQPSAHFDSPAVSPASTARAALSASRESDLPVRRRWRRLGLSTSNAPIPADLRWGAAGALHPGAAHEPEALRPRDKALVVLFCGRHAQLSQTSGRLKLSKATATCASRWVSTPSTTYSTISAKFSPRYFLLPAIVTSIASLSCNGHRQSENPENGRYCDGSRYRRAPMRSRSVPTGGYGTAPGINRPVATKSFRQ